MDATLKLGHVTISTQSPAAVPTFATIYEGLSLLLIEHGRVRIAIDRAVNGNAIHERLVLSPSDLGLTVVDIPKDELLFPLHAKVQEMREVYAENNVVEIPDLQALFDRALN